MAKLARPWEVLNVVTSLSSFLSFEFSFFTNFLRGLFRQIGRLAEFLSFYGALGNLFRQIDRLAEFLSFIACYDILGKPFRQVDRRGELLSFTFFAFTISFGTYFDR